jgi:2'-5' RNA ligase
MPATEFIRVRKDASTKSTVTSDAVGGAGKAPPAQGLVRDYPGTRVKMPPVDDTADTSEEITLPRKCGCTDVKKCACQAPAVKAEEPTVTTPEVPEVKAQQEDANAVADDAPGVMLALVVPEHVAKSLVQPDGTPHHEMHVTLGYYGKVGKDIHKDAVETVTKCVAMSAEGYKPAKAHIGGVGRFNGSKTSDNKDVLIAHVDSPGLHEIRDHLIEHVKKCAAMASSADGQVAEANGPSPRTDHGYTPHITLKYMDPEADMPIHKLPRQEFTFTHLLMSVGKEKTLFPLGERRDVTKAIWMPIIKADDEKRLATGIVLQPEIVDAQGDIIGADVIERTAHNFLARYNKATQLGLQHEIMKPDGVDLVESYIAPADMMINNRLIVAGTWMMTVRVSNDVLWTKIKTGQLGGFSIGGVARVQRLAV